MARLTDRFIRALEVLGSDETLAGGTIREQATAYFGEPADDQCLRFIMVAAESIYNKGAEQALDFGDSEDEAVSVGLVMVMMAGIAIGKRLGIEDGEKMARAVANVD